METSDSEYFESADEDFDSDFENDHNKLKQAFQHGSSHKIIEPELCKLKLDEEKEENSISSDKTVENADTANSSLCNSEFSSKTEDRAIISCLENKEIGTNTAENAVKNETDTAKGNVVNATDDVELKVTKEESAENEKKEIVAIKEPVDNRQSIINDTKLSSENKVQLPNTSKIKVILETSIPKEKRKDEKNQQNQNISSQAMPEEEDNLWDDDELDWGSEAAKEESQKTENSSKSKNEDSGWDDFDVDWENESSIQPKQHLDTNSSKASHTKKSNASSSNLRKTKLSEDYGDWEPLEKPEEKQKSNEESESGWGGWGNWGVSSILNTASQSVSTLTNHVSQGLSAVLETGMGIPEPEEMARINATERQASEEDTSEISNNDSSTTPAFGLGNLVSGVTHLTKFVESTGTKVIAGSLDTLEAIGKKTVEVLQEGDPGLKKKRAFLKLDYEQPNLSEILREAKENAEHELQHNNTDIKQFVGYETFFDDHQGLVHLEALEMLSKVCNIKLYKLNETLTMDALKEVQDTLDQVRELCEIPDDDDEDKVTLTDARNTIENAVKEINIPICFNRFFDACEEINKWLDNVNLSFIDIVELHQQAVETLAQLTSISIEQFHKTAELLMVKEHRSTANEADSLVQITSTLKTVILNEGNEFAKKIRCIQNVDEEKINNHITEIYFEGANSTAYIQNAFELLIPILQVGAV